MNQPIQPNFNTTSYPIDQLRISDLLPAIEARPPAEVAPPATRAQSTACKTQHIAQLFLTSVLFGSVGTIFLTQLQATPGSPLLIAGGSAFMLISGLTAAYSLRTICRTSSETSPA